MLEVSPILAATANAPAYGAGNVNFTSGAATATATDTNPVAENNAVDPRRYSKFDRTASQVGDATMTFGDFLDMVNPLQHIPVVSAAYRGITGDTINPVSRVAGDILYGAATGLVTAVASGISAVADSVMETKSGKDVKGTMFASLFGDEETSTGDAKTEVVAAEPVALPDEVRPVVQAEATLPIVMAKTVVEEPAESATENTKQVAAEGNLQGSKGFPLDRNKLPYGGAMAPVKSMQEQNMAMALSAATGGIRIGNTIYTNRLITGQHPLPVAASSVNPANTGTVAPASPNTQPSMISALPSNDAQSTAATVAGNPASTSLPSSPVPAGNMSVPATLGDDAMLMKALGLYRSVAAGTASGTTTSSINRVN